MGGKRQGCHIVGEKRLRVELREEATRPNRRGPERVFVVAVLDEVGVGQFPWISTLRDPWAHGERAGKAGTAVADALCRADSLRLRDKMIQGSREQLLHLHALRARHRCTARSQLSSSKSVDRFD